MPQSRKSVKKRTAYHHGDLRTAVLKSAEEILQQDGMNAISIRACARAIGVSPTGPIHHFPTISALLSELAAIGFEKLADALIAAMEKPHWTRRDISWAYIMFAAENKEMFYLMNDPQRLDSDNPVLHAARRKAYEALAQVGSLNIDNLSLEQVGRLGAGWALSHGLALLLVGGRLGGLQKMAPAGTTQHDIVQSALSILDSAMDRR